MEGLSRGDVLGNLGVSTWVEKGTFCGRTK